MGGPTESGAPSPLAGRYVLERRIGHGGMGAVYLALDLKHDRHVAVKLLGDGPHQPSATRRFLAELRTAAGLSHPNILPVHDGGDANGTLYYVMPHVEGRSLRERLDRDARLPVAEAARIACQVGSALAYAHARGVVHRDVKPENILLDRQGHAYLADFGLARAVSSVEATRLTRGGVVLGSPYYISPEQATGAEDVDGRSDIYSLGCVLYEMLSGSAPFSGADAQSVLRSHVTQPAPSLRTRRADVSPALERVVATALAKSPDDRFATADAMTAELARLVGTGASAAEPDETHPVERRSWRDLPRRRMRLGIAASAVLAAAFLGYYAVAGDGATLFGHSAPLDSARFAILPLNGATSDAGATNLLLHDAFSRWRDLAVMDRLRVADVVRRRDPEQDGLSPTEALDVATELGAGRYVHGSVSPFGDSIRVEASLYDANAAGARLSGASVLIPADVHAAGPLFLTLADSLLFGRVTLGEAAVQGTDSRLARMLFGRAWLALEQWDLPAAESLFAASYAEAPGFDRALLWLAQVRNWSGAPPRAWAAEALRVDAAALPNRERLLAQGLAHLADGRPVDACVAYRELLESDDRDFAGLFGVAECISRDSLVVRDARTRTGWRFRSSYHRAALAYRAAFEALPGSQFGFQAGAFRRIREILFTRPNLLRYGWDERGRQYAALPEWRSDSLVFLPSRWSPGQPAPAPARDARQRALVEQRRAFQAMAAAWVRDYPHSVEARHALALSLAMLGDPAALSTVLEARADAPSDRQARELALLDVWLRLRFAIPDDPEGLRSAKLLADSLLASPSHATAAEEAALAVLLGRPMLAAALSHAAVEENLALGIPASVVARAAALLSYAAVGAPIDSIASLYQQTEAAIVRSVDPDARIGVRATLLELPALLAFDVYPLPIFDEPTRLQSDVARAQAALRRGDSMEARGRLAAVRARRGEALAGEVTLDILFAEAATLAALGDTAGAIAWIDPTLLELHWMPPGMLETTAGAGALVRAAALRARLARQQGDAVTARRWTRVVQELWADGTGASMAALARPAARVNRTVAQVP